MSEITLNDLEVFFRVGVPDPERAIPQRLLISVTVEFDFSRAAASDKIEETIDYFQVAQDLLRFGEGRSWKLVEALAEQIASFVLERYKPEIVTVEVKKFPIPQARWVSVKVARRRA